MDIRYQPLGDLGIRIGLQREISPEVNGMVRALTYQLQNAKLPEIIEVVPTYAAVNVYYDPLQITFSELVKKCKKLANCLDSVQLPEPRYIQIPVLYGGEVGPDLEYVAEFHCMTPEEVVGIHTSQPYLVYMLGFSPGFPYLGGMSEKIATPRLEKPRQKIAGGSVGIAGNQTGIYSLNGPGGWQIIGHTPVRLYDPGGEQVVLLRAGDYLQFKSISKARYKVLQREVETGQYQPQILRMEEEKE